VPGKATGTPGHSPGTPRLNTPPDLTAPQTGTPPLPPEEALAHLALSLGLPRGELSTALLGFARYFSLPLEPGLLQRLRREALAPRAGGEALVLAAAAAEAKGLRLTGEALEADAAALDPGRREPPGGDQNRERRQNAEDTPPGPGELQKAAEEAEALSPLLRITNRLPGKNREHWVTLPFTFSSRGLEFRVSLRILLKNRGPGGYEAERVALDIGLDSRRWLFVLDSPRQKAPSLEVYVSPLPAGTSPAALERELQEALGAIRGGLRIKVSEKPAFFADSRDETLLSVNEEV
jgi:hypothetical protein